MKRDFWQQRWRAGTTGWHRDEVHPDLAAFADAQLGDAPQRILIPLCGKSVDLFWLAERGHDAIGIEFVEKAARELFADVGVEPAVQKLGGATVYRADTAPGSITFVCADVFDVTAEVIADPIDLLWDRAALVAIAPADRQRYAAHLVSLAGNAPILLNAFTYDQSKMSGPPWSVPRAEVEILFSKLGRAVTERQARDVIEQVAFKEAGHDYWITSTYLIE